MSGPFKLKYTKNSFPFKALEEELITGAGKAVATDSEGLVAEAQKRASEKLIEGVTSVGKAFSDDDEKEEEEEEEEEE